MALRHGVYPMPHRPSLFVSEQGTRLTHWAVRATFVQLSRQIGLRGPSDSHGPRLHDFRHRFAVQTLVRWYRDGVDVERHLPELSTDRGHVKMSDTYWYRSATPELLGFATQRLEQAPRRWPSGPRTSLVQPDWNPSSPSGFCVNSRPVLIRSPAPVTPSACSDAWCSTSCIQRLRR